MKRRKMKTLASHFLSWIMAGCSMDFRLFISIRLAGLDYYQLLLTFNYKPWALTEHCLFGYTLTGHRKRQIEQLVPYGMKQKAWKGRLGIRNFKYINNKKLWLQYVPVRKIYSLVEGNARHYVTVITDIIFVIVRYFPNSEATLVSLGHLMRKCMACESE